VSTGTARHGRRRNAGGATESTRSSPVQPRPNLLITAIRRDIIGVLAGPDAATVPAATARVATAWTARRRQRGQSPSSAQGTAAGTGGRPADERAHHLAGMPTLRQSRGGGLGAPHPGRRRGGRGGPGGVRLHRRLPGGARGTAVRSRARGGSAGDGRTGPAV